MDQVAAHHIKALIIPVEDALMFKDPLTNVFVFSSRLQPAMAVILFCKCLGEWTESVSIHSDH